MVTFHLKLAIQLSQAFIKMGHLKTPLQIVLIDLWVYTVYNL